MSETLGDALPKEISRCEGLLILYAGLGAAGAFGHMMISAEIEAAKKSISDGDAVQMLRCYQKLKECE